MILAPGVLKNGYLYVAKENLTFLERSDHNGINDLVRFWQNRPDDGLVYMRDLPSRAIAHCLSNVIVWEAIGNWDNARIRLHGDALTTLFGGDIRGQLVTDLYAPEEVPQRLSLFHRMQDEQCPLIVRSMLRYYSVDVLRLDRVLIPMSGPKGVGNMALVGAFVSDMASRNPCD